MDGSQKVKTLESNPQNVHSLCYITWSSAASKHRLKRERMMNEDNRRILQDWRSGEHSESVVKNVFCPVLGVQMYKMLVLFAQWIDTPPSAGFGHDTLGSQNAWSNFSFILTNKNYCFSSWFVVTWNFFLFRMENYLIFLFILGLGEADPKKKNLKNFRLKLVSGETEHFWVWQQVSTYQLTFNTEMPSLWMTLNLQLFFLPCNFLSQGSTSSGGDRARKLVSQVLLTPF